MTCIVGGPAIVLGANVLRGVPIGTANVRSGKYVNPAGGVAPYVVPMTDVRAG